jgi:hypothetical protein
MDINLHTAGKQYRREACAYVTFLAGHGDYIKGVIGLAKSLRRVRCAYPLIVAVVDDVPDEHTEILRSQGCVVRRIDPIRPADCANCRFAMPYYVINYSKLWIWTVSTSQSFYQIPPRLDVTQRWRTALCLHVYVAFMNRYVGMFVHACMANLWMILWMAEWTCTGADVCMSMCMYERMCLVNACVHVLYNFVLTWIHARVKRQMMCMRVANLQCMGSICIRTDAHVSDQRVPAPQIILLLYSIVC